MQRYYFSARARKARARERRAYICRYATQAAMTRLFAPYGRLPKAPRWRYSAPARELMLFYMRRRLRHAAITYAVIIMRDATMFAYALRAAMPSAAKMPHVVAAVDGGAIFIFAATVI